MRGRRAMWVARGGVRMVSSTGHFQHTESCEDWYDIVFGPHRDLPDSMGQHISVSLYLAPCTVLPALHNIPNLSHDRHTNWLKLNILRMIP